MFQDVLIEQAEKFISREKKDIEVRSKPKVTKWISEKASLVKTLTEVACSAVTNNHNLPAPRSDTKKKPLQNAPLKKPLSQPPPTSRPAAVPKPAQIPQRDQPQNIQSQGTKSVFECTSTAGLQIEPAKNTNHWMTFDDTPQKSAFSAQQPSTKESFSLLKDLGLPPQPASSTLPKDLEWLVTDKEKPKTNSSQGDLISW